MWVCIVRVFTKGIGKYALQVIQQLPHAWKLLLITYSSAVSVYQLANADGHITADVMSGHWQTRDASQEAPPLNIDLSQHLHIASLQSCQEQAQQCIASFR